MSTSKYIPRIIDKEIERTLLAFGAVCIEGPKWCGKTRTSLFHSKSSIFVGDPAGNFQNRRLAEIDPSLVLDGQSPRLIDEWQEVPSLWDAVRFEVDRRSMPGQFILTGSSTPNIKGIMHSGAGRIARLQMRTMSLFESGDSSGAVSLSELCNGEIESTLTGEVELSTLCELIIRGGWPGSIDTDLKSSALLPKEYLKAILEDDVVRLDGTKRNTAKMERLLKSLARNESTAASNKTLQKDMSDREGGKIDPDTISSYLDIFKRLFITDNVPAFSANLRSPLRIKQAEKLHFCDPSLPSALLGASPQMLISDLETLGLLFESLCLRDLKVYSESIGAKLFHYQDYDNDEIDAVIEMQNGQWCAFEIKLGANKIDEAASNLIRIRDKIEKSEKGRVPRVLCVICGLSNAAYRRTDGVFVVPITALKD